MAYKSLAPGVHVLIIKAGNLRHWIFLVFARVYTKDPEVRITYAILCEMKLVFLTTAAVVLCEIFSLFIIINICFQAINLHKLF